MPPYAWGKQQGQACLVGVKSGDAAARDSLMLELEQKGFSCRSVQTKGNFGEACFVVWQMPDEIARPNPGLVAHIVGKENGQDLWHIREPGSNRIYRYNNGEYSMYRTSAAGKPYVLSLMTDCYHLVRTRIRDAVERAQKS